MKNAFEFREHYGRDGTCTLRERVVGPIVPWCLVAILVVLASTITGHPLALSPSFWQLLSKL